MKKLPLYAEIILPLALQGTFTYGVPEGKDAYAVPGMRVIVQFGKKKLISGIIREVHSRKPGDYDIKEIFSFLDEHPVVSEIQLMFWNWISNYYMCSIGEVMNAALPAGLKLSSETVFRLNHSKLNEFRPDDQEYLLLEIMEEDSSVSLDDIEKSQLGIDGIRIIKRMVESGLVSTDQHIKKAYKPRKITCINIAAEYQKEKALVKLMDTLSPAQVKALEAFARLSRRYEDPAQTRDVERQELIQADVAAHAITALLKKNIFTTYNLHVSRIHHDTKEVDVCKTPQLSEFQQVAFEKIKESFKTRPVVLLQGVTSSGKTEIYIQLIQEQINAGKQVLYLLPEIALTTQIIIRLKKVFGNQIGIYHSRYSDNERVEVYRNLAGLTEEVAYSVILGVRSAVYLPFKNLGLIIVDEEHENTYKQFDPAPRYHARDAATILGLFTGAKILMGSATPSFESLYNSMHSKYGFVELNERYGNVALPEIILADVSKAKKRKQMKAHFTPELLSALKETLSEGKQAILFQNRRGYSNYMQCNDCSYILKCKSCDVSLTYHKYANEMLCHYCGFKVPVPHQCPDCHGSSLEMRGFGTEKIEDEISGLFPEIAIGRLDLDKSKTRKAFEKVISDFEKGRTQVLVGTQIVTKGLDFENVNLVGIIDADSMLNFPDFRAFERSFQLMVQVSGRAGRRDQQGKVIIQTGDPSHPVIRKVLNNDFDGFFREQMTERKMFKYPPYIRLIRITLKHEIPSILDGGAVFLANEMREIFGNRVLGPQPPVIGRTHGKYIKQINLKIEKDASFEKAKSLLKELIDIFTQNPVYKQIRINLDVDPM